MGAAEIWMSQSVDQGWRDAHSPHRGLSMTKLMSLLKKVEQSSIRFWPRQDERGLLAGRRSQWRNGLQKLRTVLRIVVFVGVI